MTKAEAVALADSGFWKTMSLDDRALFQLAETRLCMPFPVFHRAIEHALGRSVWTHEFADRDSLMRELCGDREPPTMEEILEMIPADKLVVLVVSPQEAE